VAEHSRNGTRDVSKSGVALRVAHVLLVAPIPLCAVTVIQWTRGQEFLGVRGDIGWSIIVAAIGLGLLGLAGYISPRDQRPAMAVALLSGDRRNGMSGWHRALFWLLMLGAILVNGSTIMWAAFTPSPSLVVVASGLLLSLVLAGLANVLKWRLGKRSEAAEQ
jgi:hypothetical protein